MLTNCSPPYFSRKNSSNGVLAPNLRQESLTKIGTRWWDQLPKGARGMLLPPAPQDLLVHINCPLPEVLRVLQMELVQRALYQ